MIEASVYETTAKSMPLRKRLQFVRLVMLAILALCFIMPLSSAAAPGTNSFTDSASVTDNVAFAITGSMNVVRIMFTTTLLNNGKVLVAGGYGPPALSSAELYDPASGIWNPTSSMNHARYGYTATLLNNGKVLVAGGIDGISTASAELYDPDTGTWTTSGSMNGARNYHTATLLDNGKVLVAGGYNGNFMASAELYDPNTGIWTTSGSMNTARYYHKAVLLDNGKVLIEGGTSATGPYTASAELYDPNTDTWTTSGSMSGARFYHTATLLKNGKVLVVGEGFLSPWGTNTAELYDSSMGTWTTTTNMNTLRMNHTATLLSNGKVFVIGGVDVTTIIASAELYDPNTDTWKTIGSMNTKRVSHTATLLNNGKVLVVGGLDRSVHYLTSAELGTLLPGNTFTGTLTLPSEWLNSNTISAQFIGTTTAAAINAGALSNDNNTWGDWVAAIPDVTTTTTWNVSGEGANKPVYLRLRDINGQVATVVSATVNVDLTKPTSTMTPLPTTSPTNISLFWSGSDALSGVATYDVQVRTGLSGAWTDVLSNTTDTSTIYTGVYGITYYFRTRAKDAAGNVEDWPPDYDTFTIVDTDAPNGTVVINSDAANTNVTNVTLTLSASDSGSGVAQMSFSNDGSTWSGWQVYATSASWTLAIGDGSKVVYARFKDAAGNISANATETITLDTVAPTGSVVIAGSAIHTASTSVNLILSATDASSGVGQMLISNLSDFSGATWESYATSRAWVLESNRTVYVRYRDNAGNVSITYSASLPLNWIVFLPLILK